MLPYTQRRLACKKRIAGTTSVGDPPLPVITFVCLLASGGSSGGNVLFLSVGFSFGLTADRVP